MKTLTFLSVFFLTGLSALAQRTIAPADAYQCTEIFFQALLDKDAAAMRPLLTNDFTLLNFDGQLIDGNTFAEALAAGSVTIESGQVAGMASRRYGDAGVVTGFWRARGTVQGYRFDNEVAFSALCVRQGGGWKIASMQFTPRP